jgi:hypothetical protein
MLAKGTRDREKEIEASQSPVQPHSQPPIVCQEGQTPSNPCGEDIAICAIYPTDSVIKLSSLSPIIEMIEITVEEGRRNFTLWVDSRLCRLEK